jgi:putative membrane protein
MDDEHRASYAELQKLKGAAFDHAYIQGQIEDHQKVVQLFETEMGSGQEPQLKKFAADRLPIARHHLDMALSIAAGTLGMQVSNIANPVR